VLFSDQFIIMPGPSHLSPDLHSNPISNYSLPGGLVAW